MYNMPDGCMWLSDIDFYEWLGQHEFDEMPEAEGEDVSETYTCPECNETVSGPMNAYGMLKCVWCHWAFEAFDNEPGHPSGCICADCSDSDLTADND